MTRREALGTLGRTNIGGCGIACRKMPAGRRATEKELAAPKRGVVKGARSTPLVCAYSKNLAKVGYAQLGMIAGQIGYDGVDLTVMDGGHVNPHITNVDLVRAIESVRGANLEVPMISTTLTSISDGTAYPIIAIAGHADVHYYRLGFWPWGPGTNLQQRLAEVRNDLTSLVLAGQHYEMTAMLPNHAGTDQDRRFCGRSRLGCANHPRWFGSCVDRILLRPVANAGMGSGSSIGASTAEGRGSPGFLLGKNRRQVGHENVSDGRGDDRLGTVLSNARPGPLHWSAVNSF